MRRNALILALAGMAMVALIVAACSKDDNPTSTGGGGGGGGGGPTFNFGPFAVGQSVALTFTTAGSYGYVCNPHRNQSMTGTVNVATAGADSALVQIAPGNALIFSPAAVTIKPSGYVRWVNASNQTMHTVTRP